jgi:hypothetical protein
MEWNKEITLTFVELYEAKPLLCDPVRPKNYNTHAEYDAGKGGAKAVGLWNNMADCLFRNFGKVWQADVRIALSQKPQ